MAFRKYQAAVINWFNLNNDGAVDVITTVNENLSFWGWWDSLSGPESDELKWDFLTYRNVGAKNHWPQMRLMGPTGNRQAIAAQVIVVTSNDKHARQAGISAEAVFRKGVIDCIMGLVYMPRSSQSRYDGPMVTSRNLHDVESDKMFVI